MAVLVAVAETFSHIVIRSNAQNRMPSDTVSELADDDGFKSSTEYVTLSLLLFTAGTANWYVAPDGVAVVCLT